VRTFTAASSMVATFSKMWKTLKSQGNLMVGNSQGIPKEFTEFDAEVTLPHVQ